MFNIFHNHKALLFWISLGMLLGSISTTIAFENPLSDGLSISSTVILAIGLFLLGLSFVHEKIESICNPE
ncbi:MAG: hypothetical protein QM666_03235 [Acinetobacter sp.]